MSGLLKIRVDGSDPQSVRLTLDTRSGSERSGKSLQLQVGQEALLAMPDYLFEGDEAESQVLSLRAERDDLEERIKHLEENEANQLVASDETDSHRIREERLALHRAQEEAKALHKVIGHLDPLFSENLQQLSGQNLDGLNSDYGVNVKGNKANKAAALQGQYNQATIAEKAEILLAVLAKLDDANKRLEIKAYRHSSAEAFRDDVSTGSAPGDVLGTRSYQAAAEAEATKEEKARLLEESDEEDREEKDRDDLLHSLEDEAAHQAERPSRSEQSQVERDRQAAEYSHTAERDAAATIDSDKQYRDEEDIDREPGKKEQIEEQGSAESSEESSEEVDATDGARNLAEENNVNLSEVEGTGKDGRITKDDVQTHIDSREEK